MKNELIIDSKKQINQILRSLIHCDYTAEYSYDKTIKVLYCWFKIKDKDLSASFTLEKEYWEFKNFNEKIIEETLIDGLVNADIFTCTCSLTKI